MSYSHRIFIYGPVAALLVVVAAYALFWQVSARRLNAALDAANHHPLIPGVTFAFADKSVAGFPFRLDVVLSGVTLSHQGPSGETAWRSEEVALHELVYGRDQMIFEAAGLQSFAFPCTDTPACVFYVTPGTARASALLRNGRLARFDLDVVLPKGEDATPGAGARRNFSAQRVQFHFRRNGAKLDYVGEADGVHLGADYATPLGHDIQRLRISGTIDEAPALNSLLAGRAGLAAAAADWRAAGGHVSVEALDVRSETLEDAHFTGQLGLNATDMPVGTLTTPSTLPLVFGGD